MLSDISTKYPIGSQPRISFIPYLIIVSYLVSLIGAFTTVELLHRKVSRSGWRSWIQVAACAVSFGLVAIWGMHFVGNRAIVLGDGENEIQLYYSALYTTISAILPVIVIFIGLTVADQFYKGSKHAIVRFFSLLICAICVAASVAGMHYLGNNGTTNYHLRLSWPHVVGAAATAFVACFVSFGLFFHWAKHWVNHLWKRFMVACFLAAAVSAMHWIAAAGTWYEIQGYHLGAVQERNINLIISICLCIGACVVCLLLAFLQQRRARQVKDRAQQVVLAIATFDAEGKLLVTQNGLMPCQTITQRFHQRSFHDEFNTSHSAFQWIFRVSRHWIGILDLIPAMREHLQISGYLQAKPPAYPDDDQMPFGNDDDSSYSIAFRELFCVAAYDIAKTLDTNLQNLGSMYEDIVTTGTLLPRILWQTNNGGKGIVATDPAIPTRDVEAGFNNPILFGRGQMLVLTRRVDSIEADRLQNLGYSFAGIERVADPLARSLQIPRSDLVELVVRLRYSCVREPCVPKIGTYLASFLVQTSPGMKGLEIVVLQATPDRLPMVKLSSTELDSEEMSLLAAFDGLSLDDCLERINHRPRTMSMDDQFLEKFRNRIFDLLQDCPERALRRAVFSAQQVPIAQRVTGQEGTGRATIFAFCGIKDIYSQTLPSLTLQTIPLSFFKTHLRSYPGCPDHAILAQKNHKEFGGIQRMPTIRRPPASRQSSKWPHRHKSAEIKPSDISWRADSCSEQGLVNSAQDPQDVSSHPWGGIMVTSTRDITVGETRKGSNVELEDLGVRAEVGLAEAEQKTMVDKLMSITTSFRDLYTHQTLRRDHLSGDDRR